MKKAIISSGGKQYIVAEGDIVTVERLKQSGENITFEVLSLIDGQKTIVGTPLVKNIKVQADVIDAAARAEKVTAIRYKAKKRVHKLHGHRQAQTTLKITSIA